MMHGQKNIKSNGRG